MKNEIRSNYIKSLLAEKEAFKTKLEETTANSIREILGKTVNDKVNSIISEADKDSYEVEDIENPENETNSAEKDDTPSKPLPDDSADNAADNDDEGDDNGSDAEENDEFDSDDKESVADSGEDSSTSDDTDDNALWNDLEQYKDEDGDYDLTGMDSDSVIKVLKVMKPEDGVRVVKNDNGTITLNDDETEKEYIIDLDDVCESLGYTDDYQDETAMTTPNNDEPADPSNIFSMDGGAPKGTSKPWAGDKDKGKPYTFDRNKLHAMEESEDECGFNECGTNECGFNECGDDDCDFNEYDTDENYDDIEHSDDSESDMYVDIYDDDENDVEEATNVGGFVQQNSTSKSHVPNSIGRSARNRSKGGEYRGTQIPRYSNETINRIRRKANQIFAENKQLKEIIPELKNRIQESILINYNIGKAVKLMTENSTTRDEKKMIIQRLSEARTINEANDIFSKLDTELKSVHKIDNINGFSNPQLAESRKNIIETPLYQSDDLTEALSLIGRIDRLYKKN